MKKIIALGGTIALSVALLTGCAPSGTPSTPAGSPEPAPTVTVTVAPEAVAMPDYGFTFFHAATLGSSWGQMSSQLHYPVGPLEGCPWYGPVWETELAYTSAFMDPDNVATGVIFFQTYYLLASDGANFPRNAEGVGVGSTKAQVLAAYPSAVVDSYTDLGAGDMTRITVNDPASDSKYVFAIIGNAGPDVVDMLQWGPSAGNQWSHLCSGL